MAPTKKTNPKKRPYPKVKKTPREKIKALGYWLLPIKIEPDVAESILKEAESAKYGTAEYAQVINGHLRQAYGLK